MKKQIYVDLYGITELQRNIMLVIATWAKTEKKPIAQKEIVAQMEDRGVKNYTTKNAIHGLLKKGYIRRAVITSNQSFYVMLRSV